jgi:hypothetical protein
MNDVVNVSDFRNNISDYINRLIYKNESFLLRKGKCIVAKVVFYNEKNKSKDGKNTIFELAGLWKNVNTNKIKKELKKLDAKSKNDYS